MRYALLAPATIGLVLACTGAASAYPCKHPASIQILRHLGSGASIGKALDLLKKRRASFNMLYRADAGGAERFTTAENLPTLKYHSVEVSLLSPFPGGFIVSYDEKLSLDFNSHGVLTGSWCDKIGTGP